MLVCLLVRVVGAEFNVASLIQMFLGDSLVQTEALALVLHHDGLHLQVELALLKHLVFEVIEPVPTLNLLLKEQNGVDVFRIQITLGGAVIDSLLFQNLVDFVIEITQS